MKFAAVATFTFRIVPFVRKIGSYATSLIKKGSHPLSRENGCRGGSHERNQLLGVLGTIREDLSGDADPIQRSGEPCIHRHLLNRFHDFLSRCADIEGRIDMHRELGLGRAQGGTHGDCGEFFDLVIEPGATDYVAIGELDNEATQIGSDVLEAFDDSRARATAHPLEGPHASFVSIRRCFAAQRCLVAQ